MPGAHQPRGEGDPPQREQRIPQECVAHQAEAVGLDDLDHTRKDAQRRHGVDEAIHRETDRTGPEQRSPPPPLICPCVDDKGKPSCEYLHHSEHAEPEEEGTFGCFGQFNRPFANSLEKPAATARPVEAEETVHRSEDSGSNEPDMRAVHDRSTTWGLTVCGSGCVGAPAPHTAPRAADESVDGRAEVPTAARLPKTLNRTAPAAPRRRPRPSNAARSPCFACACVKRVRAPSPFLLEPARSFPPVCPWGAGAARTYQLPRPSTRLAGLYVEDERVTVFVGSHVPEARSVKDLAGGMPLGDDHRNPGDPCLFRPRR